MNLNRREFISTSLSATALMAQQPASAAKQGKEIHDLKDGWQIHQLQGHGKLSAAQIRDLGETASQAYQDWLAAAVPAEVQEILLEHKRIEDPRVLGGPERCKWVAEKDWAYRVYFPAQQLPSQRAFLHFHGLDTIVDVYLNGEHVAYHEDMFLPLRAEVTPKVRRENVLLLHFHSPYADLEARNLPAKWEGIVSKERLLRKGVMDFADYLGAHPYFTPIGVFGAVSFETVDGYELSKYDLRDQLSSDYKSVTLQVRLEVEGNAAAPPAAAISVMDPDGKPITERSAPLKLTSGQVWAADVEIVLDSPRLWFPAGYGDQLLYDISATVTSQGVVHDRISKKTGFRDLKIRKLLEVSVNGKKVKLWGSDLTPLDAMSHRWRGDRLLPVLDLVQNAHMTGIRAWGPGGPYADELFAETDRRGILVWAEFFHNWGGYPDSPEYRALCRREVEHYVASRKHHPSILLWCGGNENYMGMEVSHPGSPVFGRELWEQDYPEICRRLDPDRYYHPNSPYGGHFANDPQGGDSHSYTHQWYVPGDQYPVFFTENCRVSTPLAKSLKRFVGEEAFWPEGFTGVVKKCGDNPIPPSWLQLTLGLDYISDRRALIEEFYETGDTPEGLIYRFGASHGLYLRRVVERSRRGYRATDPPGERRSNGHFWWKLNSSWPQIFCDLIDYLLEPNMAYYALRRAYEPVLLSFDIGDHIYLWAVNDSAGPVEGTLRFEMRDPAGVQVLHQISKQISVGQGESFVAMGLDELGMFQRHNILFAALVDRNGTTVARSNDFAQMECRLGFPEARIALKEQDGVLTVSTDRFARSIELAGDNAGELFGWRFEDNFFDLLPGEVKKVRMLGRHRRGVVTAKAQFSPHTTKLEIGRV